MTQAGWLWYYSVFSALIIVFGQSAYFIMSAPFHKRPDVPWSQVHRFAEWGWIAGGFFRAMIVHKPEYLTDEGKRRAKWGKLLAIVAAILWVLLYISGPTRGDAL